MVHFIAMAGGKGTRFWPISRRNKPKQFLNLTKTDCSLLIDTLRRASGVVPDAKLSVITSQRYLEVVTEQLASSDISASTIVEPYGKNTAASVLLTALSIQKKFENQTLVMLPADHHIKDEDNWNACVLAAIKLAEEDPTSLVTIGIKPSSPHTGYGYIKVNDDGVTVDRFFEKPNLARANEYCANGYLWNSGMFVWSTQAIIDAFAKFEPKMLEQFLSVDLEYPESLQTVFDKIDDISIDFAILEKAAGSLRSFKAVPGNFEWSDIGSWGVWSELIGLDDNKNLLQGNVLNLQTSNSIIVNDTEDLLAVYGLSEMVVIKTKDVTMVIPKEQAQNVKKIVEKLEESQNLDFL